MTELRTVRKEAIGIVILQFILGTVGIFIAGVIVVLMLYCSICNKSDVDRERKDREQINFLRELNEKKKLKETSR